MMKNEITITLLFLYSFASGQEKEKNFFPSSIHHVDLSTKTNNEIIRQTELLEKEKLTGNEKKELDSLLLKYGEDVESVWDVNGAGCSWYCGGGNFDIKGSSFLHSKNGSYPVKNANDFSYRTAWVEGKEGEGIGEYLEYYFKNESPRITKIIISNGYMKNETTWKNNNRVKKLKLYVDGKLFGILNLEDSRTDQTFEIGTFGQNKNGKDLVLKFEILEVYRGEKFNDTAITEIYFDGIDVH